MLATVCLILGLYPQQPAANGHDDHNLEIVSLRPLIALRDPLPGVPFGTLLMRQVSTLNFLPGSDERQAILAADEVRNVLIGMQQDAANRNELELECQGDTMLVSGAREPVAATVRATAQMIAIATRPIHVTATLLEWSDAPPPTVLSPEELKNVAGQRRVVWTGRAITHTGAKVLLRNYRRTPYVRDADVQIAQQSNAAYPVLDAFFEGTAVALEVHSLASSQDLVLQAQFASGQRRADPRALLDGNPLHPALDVPDLDSIFGTMSGRIASGGAIALCAAGHTAGGPQRVLLLSARYATPPVDASLGATALLPISALTSAAVTVHPRMPPVTFRIESESEYGVNVDDGEQTHWGRLDGDLLISMVRRVLDKNFEDQGGSLTTCGPFLMIHGSRPQQNAVEALLSALQDRFLVNAALRATTGWTDGALHDVTIPMLQGRSGLLFRGRETTSLAGMNLEVAQEAMIHDPQIDLVQSGIWLRMRITPGTPAPHAELALMLRHASEPRRRPLEPARIGDLHLIDVDVASWEHQGALLPDRDLELGQGPAVTIEGRARPTAVRVRGFR